MEYLLCVRREDAKVFAVQDGDARMFVGDQVYLQQLVSSLPMYLIPKNKAETMYDWLQIIPYIVLRDQANIFTYWRGAQAAEKRLHGKRSLGVGGHVSSSDIAELLDDPAKLENMPYPIPLSYVSSRLPADLIDAGIYRELLEETNEYVAKNSRGTQFSSSLTFRGVLHDRTDDVGRVHLGLVCVMYVGLREKVTHGPELSDPRWTAVPSILHELDQFENWSKLVVKTLFSDDTRKGKI